MKIEDIKKIASDPEAVRLFYESEGAFVVYEDGTYGITTNGTKGQKGIVALVPCPVSRFKRALVDSFMHKSVFI